LGSEVRRLERGRTLESEARFGGARLGDMKLGKVSKAKTDLQKVRLGPRKDKLRRTTFLVV